MIDFFSHEMGLTIYTRYGWLHLIQILILLLSVLLLFLYRDKIKQWKHHDKFVRIMIANILMFNMATYYISEVIMGDWTYKEHLPLHICFIANFFFAFILYTNNKSKLYKYAYFLTFAGPLPYIIFPDMSVNGISQLFGPDKYMFYQAFFSHHFLIISSLYCLFVLDWKSEKKDIPMAYLITNMIFIIVFIFNYFFGTNYIMTKGLPEFVFDIVPILRSFNYPILLLEIAGILAIFAAYIPIKIKNDSKKQSKTVGLKE